MKNKVFSPRLYLDGIRQLRIIGILATVAITLIGVSTPIMRYLSTLDYAMDDYTPYAINYLEMNPLIVLLFCAIAPLMTLYLFSFLNKREGSDFYHAIPETRRCLFVSFFASVVTWLLFIVVSTAAIITFFYAILPQLYTVNYTSVLLVSFNTFTGSLLVAASVAIAMCLTGTVFSNVLVSLLLIFLPRMLIQLAIMAINDALPIVNGLPFAAMLSYEYNVPVGLIFGFLFGDYEASLTTLSSGVYTGIVAVIYTVLALVLFVKRRSETAGQSAPTKRLQAIYRLMIGAVLASIAMWGLFDVIVRGDIPDAEMLGSIVILLLISLIAMLAFEVITTRRFKGSLKCMATSAVSLLLFCGVFFGSMYGMYHVTLSYSPTANDIQSFRILNDNDGYGTPDYFESKVAAIDFVDKQTHAIVAEQLQYSKDLFQSSPTRFYQSKLPMVSVAIKSGGTTHLRNILIPTDKLSAIYATVENTATFRAIYTELPESVSNVFASGRSHIESESELYRILRDEVAQIGFEKWYALQTASEAEYPDYYYSTGESLSSPVLTRLTCRFYEGMQWYEFHVPLDITVLPKTAQAYLEQNLSTRNNSHTLLEALRKSNAFDKEDALSIKFFNFGDPVSCGAIYVNEDLPKLADSVKSLADSLVADSIPDVREPFYYIEYEDVRIVHDDNGKGYWYEGTSYAGYYTGDTLPEWLLELYEANA